MYNTLKYSQMKQIGKSFGWNWQPCTNNCPNGYLYVKHMDLTLKNNVPKSIWTQKSMYKTLKYGETSRLATLWAETGNPESPKSKYIYFNMGILCDLNEIGLNGVKNMEKGNFPPFPFIKGYLGCFWHHLAPKKKQESNWKRPKGKRWRERKRKIIDNLKTLTWTMNQKVYDDKELLKNVILFN